MAVHQRTPRPRHQHPNVRADQRQRASEDLAKLEEAVKQFDPKEINPTHFSDLPLSQPTAAGLKSSFFQVLTDIQASAVPLALQGTDILGAAKTGSGKTLAFLIPLLEKLYRSRWTELDGLGALVISPTRELAVQIFEVLRQIGRHHIFSAGLVIGGHSLKDEAQRLARMNILVCTPGRMLQHLDQTAGLNVDNLQILVLDEADRIMDMGFQSAVDALIEHLPKQRQTLMFSATQSKRVSDLARLSLKDPEYISVHEAAAAATPGTLQQHYILTPLPEKLDTLYGFIKVNLKSKIMVFFSSGKQVRFAYESFRHLRPGIPLLHLHGRQKQQARLAITNMFAEAKYSCLFSTDVVARGVDFPAVDWVIQVDCPEDADTYIHRVGRTARYESAGKAVLFLDPSEEEGMLRRLEHKKVPIQKVQVKETKKRSIKDQLQNMCFLNPDLKYLGQKSVISYAKSIYVQKDKEVFKLDQLDLDGYALSLGLPGTPHIRYQNGEDVKKVKNASRALRDDSDSEPSASLEAGEELAPRSKKVSVVRTKYDRMFERTNQDVLSGHYTKLIGGQASTEQAGEEDEQEFLSVKRRLEDVELNAEPNQAYHKTAKVVKLFGDQTLLVDSKRREKVLKSKKKLLKFMKMPSKIVFDEDGKPRALYELQDEQDFTKTDSAETQRQTFVQHEALRVKEADADDKELARQRKREKKEKRKAREALERQESAREGPRLATAQDAGEDPLALLRSLPLADRRGSGPNRSRDDDDDDNDDGDDDAQSRPPRKKAKKWFEQGEDGLSHGGEAKPRRPDSRRTRNQGAVDWETDNLADLEALASGLLAT